jgi:hypothetical protein
VFRCSCRISWVSSASSLIRVMGSKDKELIAAMVKVTGAFQKSSEIMKATSQLIKLPQFSATMREMSMEMMKVCLPFLSCRTSWRGWYSVKLMIVWDNGGDDGRNPRFNWGR